MADFGAERLMLDKHVSESYVRLSCFTPPTNGDLVFARFLYQESSSEFHVCGWEGIGVALLGVAILCH